MYLDGSSGVLCSDPTRSGHTEGGNKRSSPADSYRLPTPEHVLERMRSRAEEGQDGWSRAGDSKHSEEPQRDTKEKQVILVLRSTVTSTRSIYTKEWMRQSGRQVRGLSIVSKVQ